MTRTDLLRDWMILPPIEGKWALLWVLAGLPVASLLRVAIGCPEPGGECCTPFFLFVLLSAILLGRNAAILAALGSTAASLLLWKLNITGKAQAMPAMDITRPGEIAGFGLFLLYCALIIGVIELLRRRLARFARLHDADQQPSGIIFSLENGQAWASWPAHPAPVRIGPQEEVSDMMRDFLAQLEVGRRLEAGSAASEDLA
jgi:hypothetical protein